MEKIKNINILIRNSQSSESSKKPIETELFTIGSLYKDKNKWIIRYENDSHGISEVIVCGESSVILNSIGDIKYSFKLIEGRTKQSDFEAEGLFVCVNIRTTRVFHNIDVTGGTIDLEYAMETATDVISNNKINIFFNSAG